MDALYARYDEQMNMYNQLYNETGGFGYGYGHSGEAVALLKTLKLSIRATLVHLGYDYNAQSYGGYFDNAWKERKLEEWQRSGICYILSIVEKNLPDMNKTIYIITFCDTSNNEVISTVQEFASNSTLQSSFTNQSVEDRDVTRKRLDSFYSFFRSIINRDGKQ